MNVTTSGSTPINFSAATSVNQGANWLSVSPTSGTTPTALTITANGIGLLAGTYTGQVVLSSPGITQQTINVTLNVSSTGFTTGGALAHLAVHGPWVTSFTLINNGSSPATAQLSFFDDHGNSLPVPLIFPQTSAGISGNGEQHQPDDQSWRDAAHRNRRTG